METYATLEKRVRKNAKAGDCKIIQAVADPKWAAEWSTVFWADDVNAELAKAMLWTHDVAESDAPGRLPTKQGLRNFLGNWIRRSCRLKPQIRMVKQEVEVKPEVSKETTRGYLSEMKLKLRRKDETAI